MNDCDQWKANSGKVSPVNDMDLVEYRLRGHGDRIFNDLSGDLKWEDIPSDTDKEIIWWRLAYPVDHSTPTPKHYDNHYTRPLTDEERTTGIVKVKLDPYRICDALNIGGGAREQIVKKGLRWTNKGDDERKVISEIMQACERRLEMLNEDGK